MSICVVLVWMAVAPELSEAANGDLEKASSAVRAQPNAGLVVQVCRNSGGTAVIESLTDGSSTPFGAVLTLEAFLLDREQVWNDADNRVLVLWGHGDNPLPNKSRALAAETVPEARSIARIFNSHRHLRRPILVGYDACTMGSAEVVWQLAQLEESDDDRDKAFALPSLVTSQISTPGTGWPYHRVLGALSQKPGMPGTELAREIVNAYADEQHEENGEVDIAVVALDPSRVDPLTEALAALVETILRGGAAPPDSIAVRVAARAALIADDDTAVDLKRFADAIAPGAEADAVKRCIEELTIHKRSAGRLRGNGGVSLLLPDGDDEDAALVLSGQFFAISRWSEFWETCVGANQTR